MISPLIEKLGPCAQGQTSHQILKVRHLNIEGVDEAIIEVLKYFKTKKGVKFKYKPTSILVKECQVGWAKAKERVSSAMKEGKYVGHWKARYQ